MSTSFITKRYYKDEMEVMSQNRAWWFYVMNYYYDEEDIRNSNPDLNGIQIHGMAKDVAIYGVCIIPESF